MRTNPLHGSVEHASVGRADLGDHPAWHCDAGNPSEDGVHTCDAAMHALSVVIAESAQVPPNPFCARRETQREIDSKLKPQQVCTTTLRIRKRTQFVAQFLDGSVQTSDDAVAELSVFVHPILQVARLLPAAVHVTDTALSTALHAVHVSPALHVDPPAQK